MAADNWAVCPKCGSEEEAKQEKIRAEMQAMYGKVPPEQWEEIQRKLRIVEDPPANFREDYEIYGAEEGTIKVSYSGECQVCGLSCGFTFEKSFYTDFSKLEKG